MQRFNEHGSKAVAHMTEYMSRYLVEWSAEALALFEDFRDREMASEQDRWCFEHPTNPLGLEYVANRLGMWAKQL
jgi:hypothetical protein